uniref:Ribosomal protein L20 n=1 Tax=Eucheuma denticulatum TaxID=305493 RepID=A0A2H4QI49_9FLOR|nr:ribosomal protein L20 [Eucheuma denticulatum]ATX68850.1 ribosomal protein L20 [Eucheuma denticulatum]
MLNSKLREELNQFKTRRTKRHLLINENLLRVNSGDLVNYNNFLHFISRERLLLNKSIITNFINTESGSLYSLNKWFNGYFYRFYC